jgi:cytochrome c oxidase assembly protein subunit 15
MPALTYIPSVWLRRYTKLVCGATFFLIFAGSMVTSTGSGLAVPDWPLSYGQFFPPMTGGIFYEHGHRMVATAVGFLTVVLAGWLIASEKRSWIRNLGLAALGTVILQGVLGGITVLLLLPAPVSVSHALLGQAFLVLTVVIAYSLSREREARKIRDEPVIPSFGRMAIALFALLYLQLLLGAVMRHTESGLAIYDFPQVAGSWFPVFNEALLARINEWRFMQDLPAVSRGQVLIHFTHRLGALAVTVGAVLLNVLAVRHLSGNRRMRRTVLALDGGLVLQILLGAATIWTGKAPLITSFHVVTGALLLGLSTLIILRAYPVKLSHRRELIEFDPLLETVR